MNNFRFLNDCLMFLVHVAPVVDILNYLLLKIPALSSAAENSAVVYLERL